MINPIILILPKFEQNIVFPLRLDVDMEAVIFLVKVFITILFMLNRFLLNTIKVKIIRNKGNNCYINSKLFLNYFNKKPQIFLLGVSIY